MGANVPKLTDDEARIRFDPERDNEYEMDTYIAPLLDALRDACRYYGIPFMCIMQFSEHGLVTSGSVFSGAHGVFDDIADAVGISSDIPPVN
jgi:hypothetical protein